VLLPETDVESARWVAERIRKRISETLCELDDQAITVTASFGVAGMIPEPGLDPMKLISVCDEALYTSKQQGRNRVTLAGKPQAPSNVSPLLRRQ
jgi:diguanylate cyclase (GGDEF)-like protein